MARVRIPNMPGVSRASGLPGIDPSAASAPGRAATEMFMELGNQITKRIVQNKEEAYQSKLNIAKMNADTDMRVAFQQFDDETKNANPDEVMEIYRDYNNIVTSQFEERIKGLRPADITALRASHENNLRMFEVRASGQERTRTFQIEESSARLDLENNLYGESEESQKKVADAIEIFKKHYKDGWKTEVDKLRGPALFGKLYEEATYATTPEQIQAVMDKVRANEGLLKSGYEYNLFTKLNANMVNRSKRITSVYNQALRTAKRGDEIDMNAMDTYMAEGLLSQEDVDNIVEIAKKAKDQNMDELVFQVWKSNDWRDIEKQIQTQFTDLMRIDNPEVTLGQIKDIEELINNQSDNPLIRNFMKGQMIGKISRAVAEPDNTFFSTHMGELIEDEVVEDIRPAAIQSFRDIAGEVQKMVATSRSDIALSEMMTKAEELVVKHYKSNMSIGREEFQTILNTVSEIGALTEVEEVLNSRQPAQAQTQPKITQQGVDSEGNIVTFELIDGQWQPIK